jgi:predicted RNase H-like HicB family nuclease
VLYDVWLSVDETGTVQARVPAVPGCHTQSPNSPEELSVRVREALSLFVDDDEVSLVFMDDPERP